jgi:fluoride exporter
VNAAAHARSGSRPTLPPLRLVAAVALGGACGGSVRAALWERYPVTEGAWPWVTFAENLTGSLLLGFLVVALAERRPGHPMVAAALGPGLLGSYTTYATFAVELTRLVESGAVNLAAGYAAATVGAGLALALAGMVLARRLPRARSA